jgi:hypothetical protein
MLNTPLVIGQFGRFTLGAIDGGTPPVARPVSFNVKSDNYDLGYVLTSGGQVWFVTKGPAGVGTITITGTAASGAPLTPTVMQFTVTATPPAPDAVAFTESAVAVGGIDVSIGGDPGVDNVSGSL